MKEFKKVKMLAKNSPAGSYVAGCPAMKQCPGESRQSDGCAACERTR